MTAQRIAAIVGVAAAAALLSGCAPVSVADGQLEYRESWQMDTYGSYPAYWEDPDRLIVILGGSSSCPSIPTAIDESDSVVTITVTPTGGPVCTADMAILPTLFILDGGRPDEVVVKSGTSESRYEVVDSR